MSEREIRPYPFNIAQHEYDALQHYSLEDFAHPRDQIAPPIAPYRIRDFYGASNFDANARNNFSGVGPKGYRRTDQLLREEICDRLCDDADVDATHIEVSVRDGVVELIGTVADHRQKYRTEFIADAVRGVLDVINRLHVDDREDLS